MLKVICLLAIFSSLNLIACNQAHWTLMKMIADKPLKDQFKVWHYAMKRPYDINTEYAVERFLIFKENAKKVQAHNAKNLSYRLGLGEFADWTPEEFTKKMLPGLNWEEDNITDAPENVNTNKPNNKFLTFDELLEQKVKDCDDESSDDDSSDDDEDTDEKTTDWSEKNWTKIKNQGSCGSCWAFASTAIFESKIYTTYGEKVDLSEQELVDCIYPRAGCYGGSPCLALNYLYKNAIHYESEYKYNSTNPSSGTCLASSKSYDASTYYKVSSYSIKYFGQSATSDENNTSAYEMLKNQPYGGVVYVEDKIWQLYESGTLKLSTCGIANHAVVVVQANKTNGYFKVKNSWGESWGESGYVNVAFGESNSCSLSLLYYVVNKVTTSSA